MAESEGFEPPVPFRVRLISSQVHSTGLCQLSALFTTTCEVLWDLAFTGGSLDGTLYHANRFPLLPAYDSH
jgi:hypothetical protein